MAMSAMFATWKAYDALESTYWFVTFEKNAEVRKAKKKVNKYKRAIKRLQDQVEDLTQQRNQIAERDCWCFLTYAEKSASARKYRCSTSPEMFRYRTSQRNGCVRILLSSSP